MKQIIEKKGMRIFKYFHMRKKDYRIDLKL